MSKKRSGLVLVMQDYPPLSSRCWYELAITNVVRTDAETVEFEFEVVGDARQAGRSVLWKVTVLLVPRSPLTAFLKAAFGLTPAPEESVDLADLLGQRLQAKFAKADGGDQQRIVSFGPSAGEKPKQVPQVTQPETKENGDGLAQTQ